jgi:hypothetical protein
MLNLAQVKLATVKEVVAVDEKFYLKYWDLYELLLQ